jgi:hypothetical protein
MPADTIALLRCGGRSIMFPHHPHSYHIILHLFLRYPRHNRIRLSWAASSYRAKATQRQPLERDKRLRHLRLQRSRLLLFAAVRLANERRQYAAAFRVVQREDFGGETTDGLPERLIHGKASANDGGHDVDVAPDAGFGKANWGGC